MPLLDQLNPQQREGVTHEGGPLLVLAGAGSGKTRVITYRVAHLIERMGARPDNILAVTFTNKAAEEMRERVKALLGGSAGRNPSLWMATFHSTCVRLLRRDGPAAGIARDFTIYDEDDQAALLKTVLKDLGLDERFLPARAAQARISHWKNQGLTPRDAYQAASDPRAERLAVLFEHYQQALRRNNALDFDDLLLEAVRMLETAPEVALKYNERFQHLLVDEYQDTNRIQYRLIRLLTQMHQNLVVVGDEDQSIYGWRGADIRNILEFERDFPEARIIRLEQNYRSTKNILAAASAVVANNQARIGKTLWTEREGGPPIGFYQAADAEQEALFIADTIESYLKQNRGRRVAVLYRVNAQSRLIEEALRRYGLKYHVVGGFSFYERAEIKDLVAYLKAASNQEDSLSLLRIINTPPRGIGETTIEKLETLALENNLSLWAAMGEALERGVLPKRALSALADFRRLMDDLRALAAAASPTGELLRFVLDRTHFLEPLEEEGTPEALGRMENIQELLNAAADSEERGETLAEFLDHAALVSEADDYDERAQVTLLTLHSAKGLEFSLVFLAGMGEGLFPHSRSLSTKAALEEERRLCYVGMTRAEDRLVLTRALERRHYGAGMPDLTEPSRFLDEVPAELLDDLSVPSRPAEVYEGPMYNSVESIQKFFAARGVALPRRRSPGPRPPTPGPARGLKLGQRVRHPKFGVGTVLRREGEGQDAKITVSFPGYGLKKLVERYAGLEEV